ncbi:hypothetical protein [Methylobacterium sp. C1]|uniref:hypothetical protein n=1 Tax=Methylobacterium sp. C1 TaxID=1479019 RepID=UPI0008DA2C61|nr:hypothetical protein [Methylobacterium sp. C1]
MEHKTFTARIPQRIAAELEVPVASLYDQGEPSSRDSEAMPKAVAALLSAYAAVRNPQERQRSVAVVIAEAERLRNLLDASDKE